MALVHTTFEVDRAIERKCPRNQQDLLLEINGNGRAQTNPPSLARSDAFLLGCHLCGGEGGRGTLPQHAVAKITPTTRCFLFRQVTAGMRTSDLEWVSLGGGADGDGDGAKAQRRKQPGKQKSTPGGGPKRHRPGDGGKTRKPVRKSGIQENKRRVRTEKIRGPEGGGGGGGGAASSEGGRERRSGRRRLPPSDLAKRAQLLEALVLWTFRDVIVPLVRGVPAVCRHVYWSSGRRVCVHSRMDQQRLIKRYAVSSTGIKNANVARFFPMTASFIQWTRFFFLPPRVFTYVAESRACTPSPDDGPPNVLPVLRAEEHRTHCLLARPQLENVAYAAAAAAAAVCW